MGPILGWITLCSLLYQPATHPWALYPTIERCRDALVIEQRAIARYAATYPAGMDGTTDCWCVPLTPMP